ncbi:MAG: cell division protein FtsZ [Crocinitomicaceae bacterium]|nr:cell division protein FtsZ [Crocinitomicaceae bacterium]
MNETFAPPSSEVNLNAPIKVIGVGGGGSNAVNTMYDRGIQGVDFIVCNTDAQALEASPVPVKVQLGLTLTGGQGAGSLPEVGRNAAIESLDEVKELIGDKTSMVFITAGMGGGTGTGAAPVIAQAAREMNILTVGIVTIPFQFEGKRRTAQAQDGLEQIRQSVDTLLIIRNDKLRELYGNLTIRAAFNNADEILCTAAKGIAEVITLTGEINVDMNDVNTVMRNSGRAIMGSGTASGEGRARTAVIEALESPLLNDCDITGAHFVLLNITFGNEEILMDEIMEITDFIQSAAGQSAEVIWGYGVDESLTDDLCVTVIATGFEGQDQWNPEVTEKTTRFVLGAEKEITSPVNPTPAAPTFTDVAQASTEKTTTAQDSPFLKMNEASDAPQETLSQLKENTPEYSEQDSDIENVLPVAETGPPEDESMKVYTLDSDPLPATSDEPNLGGIRFHEAKKEETGTPQAAPLSQTTDATSSANRVPIQPVTRQTDSGDAGRNQRIQQFTRKLKTPGGLANLEAEPAYKRRQVILDDVEHSSKSQVSRFTLNEQVDDEGERHVELRNDNPFLHDNVD